MDNLQNLITDPFTEPEDSPQDIQTEILSDIRPTPDTYQKYINPTYNIVSIMAFLSGVEKRFFEGEQYSLIFSVYESLIENKNARIIRNLCRLRTSILRNWHSVYRAMYLDVKNLHTLPEYIPQEVLAQLQEDGLEIIKANYRLSQYIIDLNRYIQEYIGYCQSLFPIWLDWGFIRELFIMPGRNNEKENTIKSKVYLANVRYHPYQVYLNFNRGNWENGDFGNIFFNDQKFVTLLYQTHGETFSSLEYVTDIGDLAKGNIYDFLANSKRTALVVDCENSDPYQLYATLVGLKEKSKLDKIEKIILYNDVNAGSTWNKLDTYINRHLDIPVQYELMRRIKNDKSLVDIGLTAGTCREFFQNQIDSFIIVSSDSDFWALISALPEAHFLVMAQKEKCSTILQRTLKEHEIRYCFIDDFCANISLDMKIEIVMDDLREYLKQYQFNINDLLRNIIWDARLDFSPRERTVFLQRYVKKMRLHIEKDGTVSIIVD